MLKSCVLVLLVVGLSLGLRVTSPPDRPTPAQVTLDLPLPAPSPPAPIAPRRWTVAAVGDVLLHGALQRQAATSGFQGLWREVEPQFHRATVVYANLEGPTAPGVVGLGKPAEDPGAVFDNRVYTSYPMFNYPPALLDALQSSGVGVVSTANNHSLDRGILGVRRTIAELDTRNLAFTGTREDSESSRAWYVITNTDGLTVAWLACTYGTNGIPDRQGQVLDCYKNREQLLDLVRDLSKDEGLGAIIVTPHWGVEYASTPSQREKLGSRAHRRGRHGRAGLPPPRPPTAGNPRHSGRPGRAHCLFVGQFRIGAVPPAPHPGRGVGAHSPGRSAGRARYPQGRGGGPHGNDSLGRTPTSASLALSGAHPCPVQAPGGDVWAQWATNCPEPLTKKGP